MRSLCLVLCLAFSLPACSHFSESGRERRAYAHLVKKAEKKRKRSQKEKLQARHQSWKKLPPTPPISDLQISATVETASE